MKFVKRLARWGAVGAASVAVPASVLGGTLNLDFSSDITANPDFTIGGNGVNPLPWVDSGGNPGGFMAVTWPINGLYTGIIFPDIDPGKIVTSFNFKCDLRVGNSVGDRAADGFSISFARDGDPVLDGIDNMGNFAGGIAEGGTTTGIAVDFDTWSGNTLPDGADIEGLIVRVDNVTVLRQSLPTRHGACDDVTSLQTGPRDAAYWAAGGDPTVPEAWATLCWQPFEVDLNDTGKLSVSWKGQKVLDGFQTSYFPTAGRLVFAGRTGDANEHTHVDNLVLTTVAATPGAKPTAPTGLAASETGSTHVVLNWTAGTIPGEPEGRVAYQIERSGTVLVRNHLTVGYTDFNAQPGKSYTYTVYSKDVAGQLSDPATVTVNTPALAASTGFLKGEIYDGITGTQVEALIFDDPRFAGGQFDRVRSINGLSFGFGGQSGPEFGDNYGIEITGTLTVPTTGAYRFFVRSDDASQFYLNTTGSSIPTPGSDVPIAEETDCCDAFQEPDITNDDQFTYPTSEAINLTAGTEYGFSFVVKEGGGGDNGEVAMRREGDTTPAASLTAIRGAFVKGQADAVGATAVITQNPTDQTVTAYFPVTFTAAATTSSTVGNHLATYQWYKNGAPILGANAATYSIPVVQPGDNGAKFKVAVLIPGSSVESPEVTLTVNPNSPAKVASASGSDSFNQVTVTFDQPVAAASAGTAANYQLDGGVTVSAATVVDPFTVRLTTSQQAENTAYNLTVSNVQNLGGTPVAAGTTATFTSWQLVAGRARADQFTGFNGAADSEIDTVLNDAKWPNNPDVVRYVNGLQFGEPAFGDTWGENHMVAIKGLLKPTETAQYNFFIRSDDASRLYVNTSGAAIPDPLTTDFIANETGCCAAFQEVGDPRTTATPLSLTAGQTYGVLFLVKEGGGGDWGQVAWRKTTDTTPAASLPALVDHVWWYGPPAVAGPIEIDGITLAGGNVEITWTTGTLQSADSVEGPWADVAGATSPYTTPATGGAKFYRLEQ